MPRSSRLLYAGRQFDNGPGNIADCKREAKRLAVKTSHIRCTSSGECGIPQLSGVHTHVLIGSLKDTIKVVGQDSEASGINSLAILSLRLEHIRTVNLNLLETGTEDSSAGTIAGTRSVVTRK